MQIGIISEARHAGSIQSTLVSRGHVPVLLGGDPRVKIPKSINVVVLRTVSCSHAASDAAQKWKRDVSTLSGGPRAQKFVLRGNSQADLNTDLDLMESTLPQNKKAAVVVVKKLRGKAAKNAIEQALRGGATTFAEVKAADPRLSQLTRSSWYKSVSQLGQSGVVARTTPHGAAGVYQHKDNLSLDAQALLAAQMNKDASLMRYLDDYVDPAAQEDDKAPQEEEEEKKKDEKKEEVETPLASRVKDLEGWIELLQEEREVLVDRVIALEKQKAVIPVTPQVTPVTPPPTVTTFALLDALVRALPAGCGGEIQLSSNVLITFTAEAKAKTELAKDACSMW